MPAGTTSVTFTAAELQSIAPASNYPIAVNAVITAPLTNATYNGKKYYFVKEYSLVKQATAQ